MIGEIPAQYVLESLIKGVLNSGTKFAMDASFDQQIGDYVDNNSTHIASSEEILSNIFKTEKNEILDFGCGTGGWRNHLEQIGYKWRGVNYKEGMATSVREVSEADSRIEFYDGLHLPYDDTTFDAIFSFQVFEHIQDIGVTFSELARVLKPGGALVGSVGYLEQFHDFSTYNFTPYGMKLAVEGAGLKLHRIYPSYDVFTWLTRRLLVVTTASDDNSLSPTLRRDNAIHDEFLRFGERMGLSSREINLLRLMFSANFTFHIVKP